MGTVFFHIDVNNAFLSWSAVEALKNGGTDLRLIPSIVGGDIEKRHGVVLAKSTPAKTFGIKTGEPVTDALKKCPDLVSTPPDHALYKRYSLSMLDLLKRYFRSITRYSIDECFAVFDPSLAGGSSPAEYALIVKDAVKNELGFTVNIGISENRLLAKMASDFEKPDKVHTLFPDEIKEKMWPLPVRDLFFVGRSSEAVLQSMGIKTIGDLAAADPELIEARLKTHGRTLWEYANGLEISPLAAEHRESKGIGNSRTVESDIIAAADAYRVLDDLCGEVSVRLKDQSFVAGSICVEIKYSDFTAASHQMPLSTPSNERSVLSGYTRLLFDELWDHRPVRLLG
ncbi:MAG: DNA polymerase IV, partial [Lachnospiraceae bacterium]|nr:DNA polymerase IV [Lachnospiraceae bacterium]